MKWYELLVLLAIVFILLPIYVYIISKAISAGKIAGLLSFLKYSSDQCSRHYKEHEHGEVKKKDEKK